MKDDFKRKFIDILFESEEDEEEGIDKQEEVEAPKSLNAKDILYHNNINKSAFIDLDDTQNNIFETNINTLNKELYPSYEDNFNNDNYEKQPTISPIFGIVNDEENHNILPFENTQTQESSIKKPLNNHLGTVISPIYGYAENNEDNNETNISIKKIDEYKEISSHNEDKKNETIEEVNHFENHTLADILEGLTEKTYVSEQEINIFDDLFEDEDE